MHLKFWIILIYGLHHIFHIERIVRIRFIFFREKDVYIRCFQITQQRVYIVGFTILYPHNRVYSFPPGLFCDIISTQAFFLSRSFLTFCVLCIRPGLEPAKYRLHYTTCAPALPGHKTALVRMVCPIHAIAPGQVDGGRSSIHQFIYRYLGRAAWAMSMLWVICIPVVRPPFLSLKKG